MLSALQVVSNLALGPLEPIVRVSLYGELVYSDPAPLSARPATPSLQRRLERSKGPFSLYGSTYLLTAGLLNALLIFDAWDIGIGRKR